MLFRVLQGGVSGPMIPGSQALLLTLFPESKKGTALAIWSMTTLVAPICGPILGGYISDNYAWGWIFLINVPVGCSARWSAGSFLKSRESPAHALKIDGVGLGSADRMGGIAAGHARPGQGPGLVQFQHDRHALYRLHRGPCGVDHLGAHGRAPIVDLTLFKSRSFTLGTLALCLVYGVFFGNRRADAAVVAEQRGLHGDLGRHRDGAERHHGADGGADSWASTSRATTRAWFATVSFVVFAASYFMRAAYPPDASFWVFAMPTLVQGVAMGIFFVALFTIALDGLPPERIPAASGLNNFLRITASGFATSLTTTYWDRRESVPSVETGRVTQRVRSEAPSGRGCPQAPWIERS